MRGAKRRRLCADTSPLTARTFQTTHFKLVLFGERKSAPKYCCICPSFSLGTFLHQPVCRMRVFLCTRGFPLLHCAISSDETHQARGMLVLGVDSSWLWREFCPVSELGQGLIQGCCCGPQGWQNFPSPSGCPHGAQSLPCIQLLGFRQSLRAQGCYLGRSSLL